MGSSRAKSQPNHPFFGKTIGAIATFSSFNGFDLMPGILLPVFLYFANVRNRALLFLSTGHFKGYCSNLKRLVPYFYQSVNHL